ncbi:hypothetical protein FKW77_005076 [Venturia effusa]|uniref:Uncharacterized protein n=1 Tax=Venturia effusa TaxID=50376 RepID=A0A517LQ40_9PEZI|nr:hypothetical protein FKW77_005076 [Venturia effusa]
MKTFLSLPAELRQPILYTNFNTTYTIPVLPIPADEDPNDFMTRHQQLFDALHNWENEVKNCQRVVEDLMKVCKDARMKEDVRFIAHKRIEELAGLLGEMIEGNGFWDEDFEGTRENSEGRAAVVMMGIAEAVGGRLDLVKRD